MCGVKAAANCGTITAPSHCHYACAKPACDFLTAVGAPIVRDDDFTGKTTTGLEQIKRTVRGRNTMPKRSPLV
jgi:hypothetical protein